MNYWRFIPLIEASGRVQMAIDRWLLQQHQLGKQPSTLRFYTWSPAAISLGYHQRQCPPHWQHISWQGKPLELVRRPTGGRAVLHQGDLTYMLVTSGLDGQPAAVYKTLCQFLVRGWRSLGMELDYGYQRRYIHSPNCFAAATNADLVTADGYKFIGSAQLRQGKAILQHGSMKLSGNQELFKRVFGEHTQQNTTLNPMNTDKGQISTIITALKSAAAGCFGVEFQQQPLLESEWREIESLVKDF
jgi:lipoate-protein ligase A